MNEKPKQSSLPGVKPIVLDDLDAREVKGGGKPVKTGSDLHDTAKAIIQNLRV